MGDRGCTSASSLLFRESPVTNCMKDKQTNPAFTEGYFALGSLSARVMVLRALMAIHSSKFSYTFFSFIQDKHI